MIPKLILYDVFNGNLNLTYVNRLITINKTINDLL